MKKYLIVLAVAALLIGGWFAYEVYAYYNPDCGFVVGKPQDEETELYIETLTYFLGEKSVFGMPKSYYTDSSLVLDKEYELRNEILDEYSSPMRIVINIEEKEGKTIVTYEGFARNKLTGQNEPVKKSLEMNFIVGER